MQTLELDYQDKIIFISGAGAGMGRLAAQRFAEANAKLVITDIDAAAIDRTAAAIKPYAGDMLVLACDVTQESDIKSCIAAAYDQFGAIDVAINNAGVLQEPGRFADIAAAEFQRNIDINASGVFCCMKYQLAAMKQDNKGVILNLASAAGLLGAPYMAAYAAAKHAVIGMTRTAALEYARFNIRINALCPSYVDSPMVYAFTGNKQEQLDKLCQAIPMKRLATMSEVVNAMLWLCSDYNSYMTGQAISIDGGLTAG